MFIYSTLLVVTLRSSICVQKLASEILFSSKILCNILHITKFNFYIFCRKKSIYLQIAIISSRLLDVWITNYYRVIIRKE